LHDVIIICDVDDGRIVDVVPLARELFEYANTFLEQGILLTRYMEELREEARKWLSKQTSKT
jgi:PAS domain-containing protein